MPAEEWKRIDRAVYQVVCSHDPPTTVSLLTPISLSGWGSGDEKLRTATVVVIHVAPERLLAPPSGRAPGSVSAASPHAWRDLKTRSCHATLPVEAMRCASGWLPVVCRLFFPNARLI